MMCYYLNVHFQGRRVNTQCTAISSFDRMASDYTHDQFFNMPLTLGACNNPDGYDVREYVIYFVSYWTSYRCRVSTTAAASPWVQYPLQLQMQFLNDCANISQWSYHNSSWGMKAPKPRNSARNGTVANRVPPGDIWRSIGSRPMHLSHFHVRGDRVYNILILCSILRRRVSI